MKEKVVSEILKNLFSAKIICVHQFYDPKFNTKKQDGTLSKILLQYTWVIRPIANRFFYCEDGKILPFAVVAFKITQKNTMQVI